MEELPINIYQSILNKLDEGNDFFDQNKYKESISYFDEALELIPEVKEDWAISSNIFVALGDSYHMLTEYGIADYYYNKALQSELGIENAYVWYVSARNYLKMNYPQKATDYFMRAYMLGEKEIFKVDDFQYFPIIKKII